MTEPHLRLQAARKRAGYDTAQAAAEAFGWRPVTYRKHESGDRGLRMDVARRYARAFRVDLGWLLTGKGDSEPDDSSGVALASPSGSIPVLGEVVAGVWREAAVLEPTDYVQAIPDPRYPPDAQFALWVKGDSCNQFARNGSLVTAVHFMRALPPGGDGLDALIAQAAEAGRDCMVVVERRRHGLSEATLKALVRDRQGYALETRSTNPKWAGRVAIDPETIGEDGEIVVTGVVIAKTELTL